MDLDWKVGDRMTKDLFSKQGDLLVREGTLLTPELIKRLLESDLDLGRINEDDWLFVQRERAMKETMAELEKIFTQIHTNNQIIQEVETSIVPQVEQMTAEKDLAKLLHVIKAKDDYTYRHTVGVSILSRLIGTWLKLDEVILKELTLGAVLHDIGKVEIPDAILNKPGALTKDEYRIIQDHTVKGYRIIQESGIYSDTVALMALEHHEREDGTGYPYQKTRNEIHLLSKILAVADVFHAMTSDRVYRKGMALYDVLLQMRQDRFGKLEPRITDFFVRRFMEQCIGSKARLNDGSRVEIVFIPYENPICPIVKQGTNYIDLRMSPLYIQELIPVTVKV
ncbi:HD-GYP domain-containing protein [Halalkalibacterium halodurans]|uniref:HD-GYP domain-containing protein n=1 Tax=Halalkalibacterium halodurans TaxID=86665 RepID=UPI002AAA4431|nr:HD-GYP domain-containing protein [Halalkalibacterium halodurans]MDY7224299.1 HD-GYP domain-containing protein [Halalkalibacterium halodurans]MDY7243584.1 HD-GYP domain-containing protein [Halalkalibacterium halodurans]